MPTGIYPHPSGENHPNWKGGKPKCLDCDKMLTHWDAKRCKICAMTKENHPQWKGGFPNCTDCGKKLRSYVAKRCQVCMGLANSGENHYNWRGGKTRPLKKLRTDSKYIKWRTTVFTRDNYTCVKCKIRSSKNNHVNLEPDHIVPVSSHLELVYSLENGATLCVSCHREKTRIDRFLGIERRSNASSFLGR